MSGFGRALTSPLLVLNFTLAIVGAGIAGWALNRNFNCAVGIGTGPCVGNEVTYLFLPISLIACCLVIASKFAGAHHLRIWTAASFASAAATALIATLLSLFALGLAVKEIKLKNLGGAGYRPDTLKALEAIIIILGFFQVLYVVALHGGVFGGDKVGNPIP